VGFYVCLISRLGGVLCLCVYCVQLSVCYVLMLVLSLQCSRAGVRSLTGGVATVGFEGLAGLAAIGEKYAFVKGLTYV
jgi:hypothetical protein